VRFVRGYLLTQWGTCTHKFWVAYYMLRLLPWLYDDISRVNWVWRAIKHDWSKFRWDEASYFARTIFDLKHSTYGSQEYRELLSQIRPAIERHYQRHDHHPEHWATENEFVGHVWDRMPLVAQLEMICDWAAAVRRHEDGDLRRSIELNRDRWAYDEGKVRLFLLQAKLMGAIS